MGAHLIDNQFQSDKYPTTPRGKVPLSCKDKQAQDLLWTYAQRHRPIDKEFSDDLEAALKFAGYVPPDTNRLNVTLKNSLLALAELGFNAYTTAVGGKTHDGREIPKWHALGEAIQAGWRAAVVVVLAVPTQILVDGLVYHEHDGHNMPKKVARDALEALGVPRKDQP